MWPQRASDLVNALGQGLVLPQAIAAETPVLGFETDSRKARAGYVFLAIKGDTHDGHDHVAKALEGGCLFAVVQQSWVAGNSVAAAFCARLLPVENVLEAFRNWAKFSRRNLNIPLIAVGGSSGKTTTKEFLTAVLKMAYPQLHSTFQSQNGFLGIPLTFANLQQTSDLLVLEVGIDATGAMQQHVALAQPDVAVLTALGPEHLDGLGTWENARAEELKLFLESPPTCVRVWQCADSYLRQAAVTHVRAQDVLVIQEDDEWPAPVTFDDWAAKGVHLFRYAKKTTSLSYSYTPPRGPARVTRRKEGTDFPAAQRGVLQNPLLGSHNHDNLALAVAVACIFGLSSVAIQQGLAAFKPPARRSRIEVLPYNCHLYDDCYNANPASMNAAFSVLKSQEFSHLKKVLFLGDMLELGEESKSWHVDLAGALATLGNCTISLYGDEMTHLYEHLLCQRDSEKSWPHCVLAHLPRSADPRDFLKGPQAVAMLKDAVVLVKGSRGMAMERVIDRVKELVSFCRE